MLKLTCMLKVYIDMDGNIDVDVDVDVELDGDRVLSV